MKRRYSIGLTLVVLCSFYLGCFNRIEAHEVGIAWDRVHGTLWLQPSGMFFTPPWVLISTIDTRPQRVCVLSASRAFDCRLVQFVPSEYRAFIAIEGWRYYWWSNRLSFNSGHAEEYRGMKDVLRGYAFSPEPYPFIRILPYRL